MSADTEQPIRPAATVIVVRDRPAEPAPGGERVRASGDGAEMEVFMLRRTSRAAFAGGMYVFPGGRVESDDHLDRYDAWRRGPAERQAAQLRALGPTWRGFWIAALRETFEESGLLLAYDDRGELLAWRDAAHEARFESYRHAVHEGRLDLLELCRRENLRLACDRLHFLDRWITPPGRPRRFDTRFFLAEAPPGQTGLHDDKETDDSLWVTPRDALERNATGDFGLMRVTEKHLETVQDFATVAALHDWALAREAFPTVRPVAPVGP